MVCDDFASCNSKQKEKKNAAYIDLLCQKKFKSKRRYGFIFDRFLSINLVLLSSSLAGFLYVEN